MFLIFKKTALIFSCLLTLNVVSLFGGDDSFKTIGYFAEWGIYGRNYQVQDIPAEKLTHINYAFAKIDNGKVAIWDSYAAIDKFFPETDSWEEDMRGNFKQFKLLKEKNPHLKTFISVGGWTGSGEFSEVASTAAGRKKFADSALEFIQEYGFDGVDIDWEFPVVGGLGAGRPEDKENYTLLLQELRATLGDQYLLTVAFPAGPTGLDAIEIDKVASVLDWINIMTYDFHGAWEANSGLTGHNSPLFDSGDPVNPKFHTDAAVTRLLQEGVPAKKIVIGVPFYGRSASGAEDTNQGLYASFTGAGPGSFENGVVDYKDIKNNYLNKDGYSYHWDNVAQVPYLYHPGKKIFISFDDVDSISLKTQYALTNQLGGVMFWELSGDNGDLIDAIHSNSRN